MSLLTARQPAYDLTSLARIQAAAASRVGEVQQQYIQQVERERKLNLDHQTAAANNRLKAQMAFAENQQSERRLQVAESAEARQQEYADERIKDLQRDAAVARSVQQFRETAAGSPSPGSAETWTPTGPGMDTGGGVLPPLPGDENGELGPPPPDMDPREQEIRNRMQVIQADRDRALAAGDNEGARILNSELGRFQGYLYGGRGSDSEEVEEGRRLMNEKRRLDIQYGKETFDERVDIQGSLAKQRQYNAQATEANTPENIAQEKLQTQQQEANVRKAQASEERGYVAPMTPGAGAKIRSDIGRLQNQLAKDEAAREVRERVMKVYDAISDPAIREQMIARQEAAGKIPTVMSEKQRALMEQQISGLQSTLDGDSSVGSQRSAAETQAPTQGKYGPVSPDGEKEAIDRYLR